MSTNKALIITSINPPNDALRSIAKGALQHNTNFILIGDEKSPSDFHIQGCRFYSLDEQKKMNFELASLLPASHYSRKNIGYLIAIQKKAGIIIETDDDNLPLPDFWNEPELIQQVHTFENSGWINIYHYFTQENIWPRGFPLEHLKSNYPNLSTLSPKKAICPIQQGLANGNPDVDAIYRLIFNLPFNFNNNSNVALGNGSWCPFNSQNTVWFREVFPLLYLPTTCSFRMTDIWRSFIAQRILWECDYKLLFTKPTMIQERNVHDLLKDFAEEVPGYLNSAIICETLQNLTLKKGTHSIIPNLYNCYESLVNLQIIDKNELRYLQAWIDDLKIIGF